MDALEELKQLVYVAHEQDNESRLQLLTRITDVFLDAPASYTNHQNNCFGDIMEQLAFALEQQVREELSGKLARVETAPHGLVRRLANDKIAVARPVLEHSPVLTDDDLIDIASQKGQQHCLAVTKRSGIGSDLASALVVFGDDEVVKSLAENTTVEITPQVALQLADKAKTSPVVQAALVGRDDVPREFMVSVLDVVSTKLRRELDGQPDADEVAALDEAVYAVKSKVEDCPRSRAEQYIDELARQRALNERKIAQFVYEQRPMEFLVGLARLCHLDVLAMENVLADPTGRTLIIVCRAMDFSLETFKAIALSPMCAISTEVTELLPLLRIYRHFTAERAQRAMRFLKMRGASGQEGDAFSMVAEAV